MESAEHKNIRLNESSVSHSDVIIRLHQHGDIGWVIERHAVIYTQEYGLDEIEAVCAEGATKFLCSRDPDRERCWIAEYNGKNWLPISC